MHNVNKYIHIQASMDLGAVFRKSVDDDWYYDQASIIIQQNGVGNMWLIGGYVYRNIVWQLYGQDIPVEADLDFIVEDRKKVIILPYQCLHRRNSYGNPKFFFEDLSIDFVPLNTIPYFKQENLEPSIENFLDATPLTIQSIAYDINAERLIGDVGINAILTRTVDVHNEKQLEDYARRKRIDKDEIIRRKMESLGF